jgi:hypothetical protein
MTRHRRQSKRRSYNRNRRTSKKMRGGLAETDRQILTGLGFKPDDIEYLFENNPNMSVEVFINAIRPSKEHPSYKQLIRLKQTAAEVMASIRANNNSIDESEKYSTPPKRARFNSMSEENSNVSNDYESDIIVTPIDFNRNGGKRKSKRNKRTMRKTRKVRRNRRQQGGRGFTTQEETSPLAYIDQREISEANMPRP